ncbi:MAG: acyl carrier protein [Eubacterium aggregans]|jgi:acyl carrier protein|uniref:Acyl carrier protein n=1 Tax=Eubacterium aggregans TaxID=81409 RepID=A0A1H4ADM1_9FIRM|nr:acyl carrier protein [Eubacterium aggregans]MDD4691811.1 acyl carrier protein [Eubacterium aggregans]MEA5073383.1 acyl carrier protein [Eubacterium aggregans]SEA34020.1 acyl carrier protein [Eubacterium aggregans]
MNFDAIKAIIVETLNCDAEDVTLEASLQEDLDADSLEAVELAMALEEAFGITIEDDELANFKTVGNIVAYLNAQA